MKIQARILTFRLAAAYGTRHHRFPCCDGRDGKARPKQRKWKSESGGRIMVTTQIPSVGAFSKLWQRIVWSDYHNSRSSARGTFAQRGSEQRQLPPRGALFARQLHMHRSLRSSPKEIRLQQGTRGDHRSAFDHLHRCCCVAQGRVV